MNWLKRSSKAIILLLSLLVLLFMVLDINQSYENAFLLAILNTLFLGIIPIFVAATFVYTYRQNGDARALLMGCSMFVLGVGSIVAGWARFLPDSANYTVTTHNLSVFLASILNLLAATAERPNRRLKQPRTRKAIAALCFAGLCLFACAVALSSMKGIIPAFFTSQGSTEIRNIILWLTIVFYFGSSVAFYKQYAKIKAGYLYWYAASLMLITIGLFAVCIQNAVGSPLSWTGRVSQYSGCLFALMAIILIVQRAKEKSISAAELMAEFFMDAESKYRDLVEHLPHAVILMDEGGRVLFSNTAARVLFQYEEQDIKGQPFLEAMISETSRDQLHGYVEAAVAAGPDRPNGPALSLEGLDKSGRIFPIELTLSVSRFTWGHVTTFVIQDVSERKQTEEALRESEERFRSVLDNSIDVIYRLNVQTGSYDYVSPSVKSVMGYTSEQYMAMSPDEALAMVHPDDIAALRAVVAGLGETGTGMAIYRQRAASGEYRWVSNHMSLTRDDVSGQLYRNGNVRDITELMQAENKLHESEELFRSVQENSLDRFTILKPFCNDRGEIVDFTYIYQNNRAASTAGHTAQELVGRRMGEIYPTFPSTRFFTMYKQVVENGQPLEFEHRYDSDGVDEWFKATVTPVPNGIAVATQIITERKRAEEALRESEERFRTTLRNSPVNVSSQDLSLHYTWQYNAQLGYVDSAVVGKTDHDLLPTETADCLSALKRRAIASGERVREVVTVCAQNKCFYYDFMTEPLRDCKDNIVGVTNVVVDITERKRAEKALKHSEEQYTELVENANCIIIKMDKDGIISFFNEYAQNYFGYTHEEAIGMNVRMLVPQTERISDRNLEKMADTILTDPDDFVANTNENVKKNGEHVWVSWRNRAIRNADGEVIGNLTIGQDITELKQLEEDLRNQNNLLESIVKNMIYGITLRDKHGNMILSNDLVFKLLCPIGIGRNAWEIEYERHFTDLDGNPIPNQSGPMIRALGGEAVSDFRMVLKNPDGGERILEVSAVPIFSNGQLEMAVSFTHDITDLIMSQSALVKQESLLLQAEKERNQLLQQAIWMKDEFLLTITHEFKTPLSVINSALQTMEMVCAKELTQRINKYHNIIRQNSNRQLRLVNNLLDVTRMDAGRLKAEMRNIDIVAQTRSIVDSIAVFAGQKELKLSFTSALESRIIGTDIEKYERILLNLLSNAVKFTPAGKSIAVRLTQKTGKGKPMVCIEVQDTGLGIPEDKKELIFEKFGQVGSSRAKQAEGTGVGLHLVKLLTELLGGEVSLESELGRGSTFTVLLPDEEAKEPVEYQQSPADSDSRLVQASALEFSDVYLK